jgi:hypothetical protein
MSCFSGLERLKPSSGDGGFFARGLGNAELLRFPHTCQAFYVFLQDYYFFLPLRFRLATSERRIF